MADAGKKIADAIDPLLTNHFANITKTLLVQLKELNVANSQEILIAIGELSVRLKTVETLIANGSTVAKTKRGTKKVETDDDTTTKAVVEQVVDAPAAATTTKMAATAHIKFVAEFRDSPEFRKQFDDMIKIVDLDESVSKKKTPEEKLNPQARLIWNALKKNSDPRYTEYNTKFNNEKKARTVANQGASQTKEANSPR